MYIERLFLKVADGNEMVPGVSRNKKGGKA